MPNKIEEHVFSCPIGGTLEIIAGRWKPEIIWNLQDGPMRFNALKREIGHVSQKMLTQQLRELMRDGLITRTQYAEIPPRVEYQQTELAKSLKPVFAALIDWNTKHNSKVQKSRLKYEAENL
ncbi:MAG: helix-turn-helix transcriptional regulator [Kordiimonadaceae bacterium]|jgi:DNA-binding HxlR family transcriptional regulator|nr:helix-turn-helix transcriptional regulator [Kordiimonadaceae bacterium]MBT6033210.1 helix-turn-helix transcriptional regulator [Kordiimonadaceae bacterium]